MSLPKPQQQKEPPNQERMFDQLNEFLAKLHSKLDKKAIIAEAVVRCQNMMRATAASIFLLENDESCEDQKALHLIMKDCFGYDKIKGSREVGYEEDSLKEFTYDVGKKTKQGLTALIAQKRESILINSRDEFNKCYLDHHLGRYDINYWNQPERIQSFIGAPLLFSGDCIGVLKVESDQVNFYKEEHKRFVENLATIVATALNSATVFAELIDEIQDLASSHFAVEILHKIVESCAHLCHAEAASLLLYDENLQGLVLRVDYGHDKDLSNIFGTEGNPFKYVYRPVNGRPGITWECYEKGEPKELNNKDEVLKDPAHANKLWLDQWNDPNKLCHSVYMVPIFRDPKQGKSGGQHGVLKVENKLDLKRSPIEDGGFTENDKSLINVFANTLAIHLKDPSIYFDTAYKPEELFGKRILDLILDRSFEENLSTLTDSTSVLTIISEFIKTTQRGLTSRRTLAEYTNDILIVSNDISKKLNIELISESLLKVFRDYEVVLRNIPGYRLHFLHQFNVFLLGLVTIANADVLRELIAKSVGITFLKEWFIASMFHDIGVTIEKQDNVFHLYITDSLNVKRETALPQPTLELLSIEEYYRIYPEVEENVAKLFDNPDIQNKIKSVIHGRTIIGAGMHNHSIVSACMIARALKIISLSQDSKFRILSAIALHDADILSSLSQRLGSNSPLLGKVKDSIAFSKNPLLFLLSFCDLVQNYGRPEMYHIDSFIDLGIHLHKIEFNKKIIDIELRYSKIPENWKHIFNDIIKKQRDFLRIDNINLKICIDFRDKNGREFFNEDYCIVIGS